ncbi:hypothetical protein Ancab_036348 [Ancistrocladus abbreviatus]
MCPKRTLLSFLAAVICCLPLLLPCNGQQLPVKAVNLGGWLVTEGWIAPDLFKGIPNGDLLLSLLIFDGIRAAISFFLFPFFSGLHVGFSMVRMEHKFSFNQYSTKPIYVPRMAEAQSLLRIEVLLLAGKLLNCGEWMKYHFNLKVFYNQFWGIGSNNVDVVAVAPQPSANSNANTFEIVRNQQNQSRIRIRAPNGNFLQAKAIDLVTADYTGDDGWGDDNPSVFTMNASGQLQGEYQVD